jgi:outer membrane protein OmpA-like peptidoglycan-associated protein
MHRTVDVSGYGKRPFSVSDGHNYFEDSPMVIADMDCALSGGGESVPPERAVEAHKIGGILGFWTKTYWKLNPEVSSAENCVATSRAILKVGFYEAPVPVESTLTETVHFELLKSNLSSQAIKKLKELAQKALEADKVVEIQIVGYTDTSGAESLNIGLSLRRAEAVKSAFVQLGLPESIISIEGKGESDLALATNDGVRESANRRATIIIKVKSARTTN